MIECKKHVDNYEEKMEQLSAKLQSMLKQVEAAERNMETILPDVELWIKRVEKIIDKVMKEVRALQDQAKVKCFFGFSRELVVDEIVIEKIKIRLKNENAELQKEVGELKNFANRLQKGYMDHEKKNEESISEFSGLRDSFHVVTLQRDEALKELNEEKQNVVKLRSKISEMEKMVEKTGEELAKKRTELQNLNKEKKAMENQLGSMTGEKDNLQKELLEAKRSANDFRAMEKSMVELQKKKFFWTLFSSVTTIVAAVSIAYAAKRL